jgi:monothiol glutaredoxin
MNAEQPQIDQEAVNKRIEQQLKDNPVILYMKGDKVFPQCGFSARVVQILGQTGVEFATHDILADSELRIGMKVFSSWPTFPQLYVKGELVGGCDIIMSMAESGDLEKLFKEKALI